MEISDYSEVFIYIYFLLLDYAMKLIKTAGSERIMVPKRMAV